MLPSEADAIDGETSLVGVPEGPYAGEQLIRTPLADVTGLKVTATGVWEIELVSPDDVPHVGDEFSGSADSVLWYDGLGGTATVTRTGNGPFWLLAADGRYLVPSAFGDFTGAEQWPAGPILFEVHGRGDWSVTIDPAGRPTGTTLPAGTFIDSATAAMAEACIGSWVELQRFGHDGTVEAEPWRTLLDVVYTECDPAIAAIDPVMVRSPAGSPVHVLWEVLWLIESEASFVYMGFASCDGPCVLPPEVAEDFMQFGPDHTDVPPSLYGYLGDVPAGEYLALIPGLTVSV